jgi:hypothetical protein
VASILQIAPLLSNFATCLTTCEKKYLTFREVCKLQGFENKCPGKHLVLKEMRKLPAAEYVARMDETINIYRI